MAETDCKTEQVAAGVGWGMSVLCCSSCCILLIALIFLLMTMNA